jgi:hypothetical protein
MMTLTSSSAYYLFYAYSRNRRAKVEIKMPFSVFAKFETSQKTSKNLHAIVPNLSYLLSRNLRKFRVLYQNLQIFVFDKENFSCPKFHVFRNNFRENVQPFFLTTNPTQEYTLITVTPPSPICNS